MASGGYWGKADLKKIHAEMNDGRTHFLWLKDLRVSRGPADELPITITGSKFK